MFDKKYDKTIIYYIIQRFCVDTYLLLLAVNSKNTEWILNHFES